LSVDSPNGSGEEGWPNLFIAGVPKAGTRSLAYALGEHPDVFVPYVDCPRFFLNLDIDKSRARFFRITQTKEEYLSLFASGHDSRYRCDASVEYVFHEDSMLRIRDVSPDARLVVILRDPVERAYSHYLNDVREGLETRTFLDAVREQIKTPEAQPWPSRYVAYGHYVEGLRHAREIFGSRLLIVTFEEVATAGDAVLSQVAEFLGLDREGFPATLGHHNRAAIPRNELARRLMGSGSLRRVSRVLVPPGARHAVRRALVGGEAPVMDEWSRALLVDEYRDERSALAELLGREPDWSFA
jgi:hypothetical protein